MGKKLRELTDRQWMVTVGRGEAQDTLQDQSNAKKKAEYEAVLAHQDVQNVLTIFPDATINATIPVIEKKKD